MAPRNHVLENKVETISLYHFIWASLTSHTRSLLPLFEEIQSIYRHRVILLHEEDVKELESHVLKPPHFLS
jgi:hypothetical protein